MVVKKGYWRRSKTSSQVLSCEERADNCLESEVSLCSAGYKGPLCGSCDLNYARNNLGACTFCEESHGFTYFKLFSYLFGILAICSLMIKSALKNSKNMRSIVKKTRNITSLSLNNKPLERNISKSTDISLESTSMNVIDRKSIIIELVDQKAAYYKIFVNFIQLVGIVRSLKVAWPPYLSNYLGFMKFLAFFSTKLLTLGCLSSSSGELPFIYIEVLALNGIFIGFNCGMGLFWMVWGRIFKIKVRRRIFISFLILYDMIQPTLVTELANMFTCKEVDGNFFLEQDLVISCDDDQYNIMTYYIFLPLLILWSLGLPFFLFFKLKRRSKRLHESSVFSSYGVFYSCYKPEYYYWDFLIMARENIVIFTTLLRIKLVLRINIILILLFIFTFLQTTKEPYITEKMNALERYAIIVALYMIFLALNQVFQADETYILLGTILMIVLIFLYILLWIKEYAIFIKKDVGAFLKNNTQLIKEMIKKTYRKSRAQKVSLF